MASLHPKTPHKYYGNFTPNHGSKARQIGMGRNATDMPSVGDKLNRPFPDGSGGRRDIGSEYRRWQAWHTGIADAPDFPSDERIREQERRAAFAGTGDWPVEEAVTA